jgi:hypothetical protein
LTGGIPETEVDRLRVDEDVGRVVVEDAGMRWRVGRGREWGEQGEEGKERWAMSSGESGWDGGMQGKRMGVEAAAGKGEGKG